LSEGRSDGTGKRASNGTVERSKPKTGVDFPTRSGSVHPPPWMQTGQTTIQTVRFRGPGEGPEPPAPVVDPVEEAAKAAARQAEQQAEKDRRARVVMQERTELLGKALAESAALRTRLVHESEEQLIALAVSIASAIVEHEIAIDPDVHGRLAQAALACMGPADKATLRASKDAFDALVAAHGGPHAEIEGVRVQFVCDPTLKAFGCIVENSDSRVDALVTTRLKEVLDQLRDEHRRGDEEAA